MQSSLGCRPEPCKSSHSSLSSIDENGIWCGFHQQKESSAWLVNDGINTMLERNRRRSAGTLVDRMGIIWMLLRVSNQG